MLIVGLDTTPGWRSATDALAASLTRAGASVGRVSVGLAPRVRTFALTDLSQAWLARRAAERGIAEHAPAAIIYCSVTAALLWPAPGAISLDSVAAENRPGRHGIWQRPVERRRLRQAPLLLPWSAQALAPARGRHAPALVVSPPVDVAPASAAQSNRDLDAVVYAGDPEKRRLRFVLDEWQRARREDETLLVAGYDGGGLAAPAGVRWAGKDVGDGVSRRASRARVLVSAPQREEFGIAALEGLAHGCMLVSTPAPGPYPALAIARDLDPRLVGERLAPALRAALDTPLRGYAERAAERLAPFASAAVDRIVADDVLPRLLPRLSAAS